MFNFFKERKGEIATETRLKENRAQIEQEESKMRKAHRALDKLNKEKKAIFKTPDVTKSTLKTLQTREDEITIRINSHNTRLKQLYANRVNINASQQLNLTKQDLVLQNIANQGILSSDLIHIKQHVDEDEKQLNDLRNLVMPSLPNLLDEDRLEEEYKAHRQESGFKEVENLQKDLQKDQQKDRETVELERRLEALTLNKTEIRSSSSVPPVPKFHDE